MMASPRTADIPVGAWALCAATVAALVVGTVIRGFIGEQWIFTTHNLGESVRAALPMLVAAAVVVGAGRWPAGRSWLLAGAWLLALHGAFTVASDIGLAWLSAGTITIEDTQPWFITVAIANGIAHALAFGTLAAGLWRSRRDGFVGARTVTAIVLVAMTVLAGVGPWLSAGFREADEFFIVSVASVALSSAGAIAVGALAVASVRAVTGRRSIPELVLAGGAALYLAVDGASWWLLVATPEAIPLVVLAALEPLANVALLVVAIGFAMGALFTPE
jgi:hypothetical protein